MPTPLLQSKLYLPPAVPNLVARPRLMERLRQGLARSLTLVSAPAGSGKTTLLSEWRAGPGRDVPLAWLSLDPGDNDPARFMFYLAAACASLTPDLLHDAEQTPPLESWLTTLIGELNALQRDFVLVLDDYHLIDAPEIHRAIEFLLTHRPPQLHLVILSRSDPPLPLARLRVRDQLVEIRSRELEFTLSEATAFMSKLAAPELPAGGIETLLTRTEGWVAGFQLAALSLQNREDVAGFIDSFAGRHHYIVDFLAQEVLDRQPANVRDFMLRISVVEQFSAPLCETLAGHSGGQAMLEELARCNLFLIPLDDERRWFRFHNLFADMLSSRLQRDRPELLPELHRSAAQWFETQQLIVNAVDHWLLCHDQERAAELLRLSFPVWIDIENRLAVNRWFAAFDRPTLERHPWLCVAKAWRWASLGDIEQASHWLEIAQQGLVRMKVENRLPAGDPEYEALPAEILAFQGLICTKQGDMEQAIELSDDALAIVPRRALSVRALIHMTLVAAYRDCGEMALAWQAATRAYHLACRGGEAGVIASALDVYGSLALLHGRFDQARQIWQQGLEDAWQHQLPLQSSHFAIAHQWLATIAYQRDDLQEVERQLALADDLLAQERDLWERVRSLLLWAHLHLARGDRPAAERLYQEIEQGVGEIRGAYFEPDMVADTIGLATELGHRDQIANWLETLPPSPAGSPCRRQYHIALQQARALAALERWQQVVALCEPLALVAAQRDCVYWSLQLHIWLALAWQQLARPDRAAAELEKALRLARPAQLVRVFTDRGEPMRALLRVISPSLQERSLQSYVRQLLAAGDPAGKTQRAPFEPLSERELQVLGLVAAGRSNREIAQELVLAVGTVKRHISNIFGKLNATSRTQCVALGRELHLLD